MKKSYLFLSSFVCSLPLWLAINYFQPALENQLVNIELAKNPPQFLTMANLAQSFRILQAEALENNCPLFAQSALAVRLKADGQSQTLFALNPQQLMAIASLSKLMTAVVVNENFQPDASVVITQEALDQPDESGLLRLGEKMMVDDLLKVMLMESSNDAAFALASLLPEPQFMELMNAKAQALGMTNSYFFNPSGLDDEDGSGRANYSTARDLVKLAHYVIQQPVLMAILSQKEYPLYVNGGLHHYLKSTNELLGQVSGVLGGKTGQTDLAGGCLLEILAGDNPGEYVAAVVLNSPARFTDMRELIKCSNVEYVADY
jgi:D-alanyl-D-alanine carboxypeptidase (penicillin-binding protein 5/6)